MTLLLLRAVQSQLQGHISPEGHCLGVHSLTRAKGVTRPFSEQLKFPHNTLCASVSSADHVSLWKLSQVCGTKHSQLAYSYSEGSPVFAAMHLVCNVWECEAVEPHLTASVALLMHLCCLLALTNIRHIVFMLKVTKDRPAENKDIIKDIISLTSFYRYKLF